MFLPAQSPTMSHTSQIICCNQTETGVTRKEESSKIVKRKRWGGGGWMLLAFNTKHIDFVDAKSAESRKFHTASAQAWQDWSFVESPAAHHICMKAPGNLKIDDILICELKVTRTLEKGKVLASVCWRPGPPCERLPARLHEACPNALLDNCGQPASAWKESIPHQNKVYIWEI